MIKAVVAGQAPGTLTGAMIDEMNAKHAKDYAPCTKEETIQLLQKGATVAAAVVRGLSDGQLAKSGRVLTGPDKCSVVSLLALTHDSVRVQFAGNSVLCLLIWHCPTGGCTFPQQRLRATVQGQGLQQGMCTLSESLHDPRGSQDVRREPHNASTNHGTLSGRVRLRRRVFGRAVITSFGREQTHHQKGEF
jgi:hypothetical protein